MIEAPKAPSRDAGGVELRGAMRRESRRRRRRGGGEWGGGIPLPSRLRSLGERRELPQGGSGAEPRPKMIFSVF